MRALLRPAHLALTFLTTLPLPHVGEVKPGEFARASGFYPLAGYAVGALVALVLWLPLPLPAGVRAALAAVAWLWASGMLHFDGLVDSADALLVMKSPQRRIEILSDVHVGAFGLAAGVLSLLTLWSLLGAARPLDALAAAVAARLTVLAPMNLFPAARAESLGARAREGWWPLACLVAAPALFIPGAWLAFVASLVASLATGLFAARRLGGGLGGDVYGACIMLSELAALLALAWGRG